MFAAVVHSPGTAVADDMIEDVGTYIPQYFAELQDAELANGRLYMFGVGGLDVVDVSNTAAPLTLGRYEPQGHPYVRYYRGTVGPTQAFAGAREDLLHLIDISNPFQPLLLEKYGTAGMSYEGSDLSGTILVACRHGDGVEILDVTIPGMTQALSEVTSLSNAWDASFRGDHVYVADGAGGLAVLDLGDPAAPIHVRSVSTSGNALDVAASGDLVVVACGSAGVDVFDVSDPDWPTPTANYDSPGLAISVKLDGDMMYLADWLSAEAVDLSDPYAPLLSGHEETPVRAMGLAAASGLLYVTDWSRLRIYETGPSSRGDIEVDTHELTFPEVPVGETLDRVLTVANTGGANLDLSEIRSFNPAFVVQPPLSAVIPAGASHDVTISYTRSQEGYDATFLRLTSDDSDEATITLPLSAGDDEGQLDVGDPAPDFSLVDLGDASHSLTRYRGRVVVMAFFANW